MTITEVGYLADLATDVADLARVMEEMVAQNVIYVTQASASALSSIARDATDIASYFLYEECRDRDIEAGLSEPILQAERAARIYGELVDSEQEATQARIVMVDEDEEDIKVGGSE